MSEKLTAVEVEELNFSAASLDEAPEPAPELSILQELDPVDPSTFAALQVDDSETYEPLHPLLTYTDGRSDYKVEFFPRGTLLMIYGQKGVRKSTLARQVIETLINGHASGSHLHTLHALQAGLKVALFDTEMHASRVQMAYKQFKASYKREQITPFEDVCRVWSVRGVDCRKMMAIVNGVCAGVNGWTPDVVVIDVISHLVDDINSQEGAKFVVDFLNQIMRKYGVSVLGLIHQNPTKDSSAADKMAGAIGTKLSQACEMQLHIGKAPEGYYMPMGENEAPLMLENEASLVTIQEYRDRQPRLRHLLLMNDNSKGNGLAANLMPVRIEKQGNKGACRYEVTPSTPEELQRCYFSNYPPMGQMF